MAIVGELCGFITIPINDKLFRRLLVTEGLWQQLHTDHGNEFVLISHVQKNLAHLRNSQLHHPVLQTTSRQNHRIERLWVEINQRVNYPVKRTLISMETSVQINMDNNTHKFCISYTTMNVIENTILNFIDSWNNHIIPGYEWRNFQ